MSRNWWVRRMFDRRAAACPAVRPRLVGLEDRVVPALLLGYDPAAAALSLTELAADADDVVVGEQAPGQLRIQFNNGATFAAGSSLDPILIYETAGDPAASTFVVVDVSAVPLQAFSVAGGSGPDVLFINAPTIPLGAVGVTLSKADDTALVVQDAVAAGFDASAQIIQVNAGTLRSTGPNPVRLAAGGSVNFGALSTGDGFVVTDDGDIVLSGDGTGLSGIQGVLLSGGGVTTTGAGNISITGFGGTDSFGVGVAVANGAAVRAAGTGAVTLTGTGGGTAGGQVNSGVFVGDGGSSVSSAGGAILITGTGGLGTDSAGISVQDNGSVVSAGGPVTLVADSITVDTDPAANPAGFTPGVGTVDAGTGTLTIRPRTAGTAIDLGGADAAGTLGLTAAEFTRVTAATLVVGDATAGDLTVSAPIAPATVTRLDLVTGGAIANTVAAAAAVTVPLLAVTAGTGVGTEAAPLTTAVGNFAGTTTAGSVVITNNGDLTVGGVFGVFGVSAAGDVLIGVSGGGTLTVSEPVTGGGANVELTADGLVLTAAVSAPTAGVGNVRLLTTTAGQPIDLGATTDPAGVLSISDAEFQLLAAGRLVQIGLGADPLAGPITVTAPITVPAGVNALVLASGGDITDGPGATITAARLAVALLNPNTAVLDAGHKVGVFAAAAFPDPAGVLPAGDITFVNSGPLTIGTVGSIIGLTGDALTVSTSSPLVVASDVNGTGDVILTAGDSAAAGDDLTVNPGVTVESTGGDVALNAGDALILAPTAVINATVGAVFLRVDFGNADPGVGAVLSVPTTPTAALGVLVEGEADDDTFLLRGTPASLTTVNGAGGADTLVAPDVATTFTISSVGGGSAAGLAQFTGIENLTGGAGGDTFTFVAGGSVTGTVDGAGGLDALDYSALAAGVTVNLLAGTASGTGGVANVENVTGGAGADFLTGSSAANVLLGNGGNDTLIGGKGADTVSGGAGDDLLIWNNGDGSDVLDGDAGTDTVQVNGSTTAGDAFTVAANGSRVAFARTNLVPFTLDIGTTETLTVNGLGGADVITAKNLTGVADLTTLALNGGADNDTFTVTPSPTVSVQVDGGAPAAPLDPGEPGDTLTLDAENNTLSQASPVDANNGTLTVPGRQPVTFASIETLSAKNVTATLVTGGAGDDTVVLFAAGGKPVYTFNGGPALQVFGPEFRFDGLAGKDVLKVDYTVGGDPLAGLTNPVAVRFDGTNKAGDLLAVSGAGGVRARYVATAQGAGRVEVTDAAGTNLRTITFQNLSPLDLTGFALVTVAPAGAVDKLTVAEGFDFLTGLTPALRVSGTSDAFAIEELAAWNNGGLRVEATGAAGSLRVAGAANGHANIDLTFVADGPLTVAGNVAATGVVTFTNSGELTLGVAADVSVSGAKGVVQDGAGTVTLGSSATLTSAAGNVSVAKAINSAVEGTNTLVVSAANGTATLSGNVGDSKRPAALAVTAKGIALGGDEYRTKAAQSYTGPTTVSAKTVTFQSTDKGVSFNGTLNTAKPAPDASNVRVATATGVLFGGKVGGLRPLATLDVTAGPTTVGEQPPGDGGAVTTDGFQRYAGPVTLNADAIFTTTAAGGDVTFGGKLDAKAIGGQSAAVNTLGGGTTTFKGEVGGQFPLLNLATDQAGLTVIQGGLVTTQGEQFYGDPVRLSADATLKASLVTFNKTLDSTDAGPFSLTVNAATRFNGDVGVAGGLAARPLADLTVNGPAVVAGSFVNTAGDQTFSGAVQGLGGVGGITIFKTVQAPGFSAIGTGQVKFVGTLDGPGGVVVTTDGDTTFGGVVGGTTKLAFLTTDGGPAPAGPGKTFVAADVTTTGGQTFADAVVLAKTVTFTSTAKGAVAFRSTLDATEAGKQGATVNTGGATTFGGPVGGGKALASLTTDAPGTTAVNGTLVQTVGDQTFGDPVTVGPAKTDTVTFKSVTTADPSVVGTGKVTFSQTLDGPAAVAVTTAGDTTFGGKVGQTTPLAALTTDGGGTTFVNGGLVSTTGDQNYLNPVSAPGDVTFQTVTAAGVAPGTGTISFLDTGSTGPGDPDSLFAGGVVTINTNGNVDFEGTVTAKGLQVIGTGGRTDLNGKSVTTVGEQRYAADVVLTEDTVLTAPTVRFDRRLDSLAANNYTLDIRGAAVFGGPVGGAKALFPDRLPLGRLGVTGTTEVRGGLVRTASQLGRSKAADGGQFYGKAVTVFADTAFEADGPVIFVSTLDGDPGRADGAVAVRVTAAGLTAFGGAVGGLTALGQLTTDGGGVSVVDGGLVRTVGTAVADGRTGDQRYRDRVEVGGLAVRFLTEGGVGSRAVTFNDALDNRPGVSTDVRATVAGSVTFVGPVGGTTPLFSLTTDGKGLAFVRTDTVKTDLAQTFATPVLLGGATLDGAFGGADVTFTSVGGRTIRFAALDAFQPAGTFGATVNTAGDAAFGPVGSTNPIAFLTTDAPGRVLFSGPQVRTAGGQLYGDKAELLGGTAFDGKTVEFANTLDGPAFVTVTVTEAATFSKAVGGTTRLDFLTVNGSAAVDGGLVRTNTALVFSGPVAVSADATFDSLLTDVRFAGTLSGPAAVRVNSPGTTIFAGDVSVVTLVTDTPGTTAVGASKVTATDVAFNDPVTTTAPAVTFTAGSILFDRTLDNDGKDVTVNASGAAIFNGVVRVGSLATDAGGTTFVNGGLVETTRTQTFGDPVSVGTATSFRSTGAGAVVFRDELTGPFAVDVGTAGDTVFNGAVDVDALTTDAPGATRVNGGQVRTRGDQRYNDLVTVDVKAATFESTAGGQFVFNNTIDGPQGITLRTAGDTELNKAVGGSVRPASLLADGGGRTIVRGGLVSTSGPQEYADEVSVGGPTVATFSGDRVTIRNTFAAANTSEIAFVTANGVTQPSGQLAVGRLSVSGGGATRLDQPANDVDFLRADLSGGSLYYSDTDDLALTGGVNLAGGGDVRLRTGTNFTAPAAVPVNVPGGRFVVYPGLSGKAAVTFQSPATAAAVILGRPTPGKDTPPPGGLPDEAGAPGFGTFNVSPDTFAVRVPAETPVFVFGNDPRPPLAGVTGDTLLPDLGGRTVTQFQYDGQDGFFDLNGRRLLVFSSIEGLTGLSQAAFVAQTAEPRDKSGAAGQQYGVRVIRTINGQPLPGGLQGARLPDNPFVVSPALVNPAASTQPPRIAFGDFGGTLGDPTRPDNVPDLVLANGPGTPPLVTVINGRVLDGFRVDGKLVLNNITNLLVPGQAKLTLTDGNGVTKTVEIDKAILAQFYAYDPGFQGGLNVAVGRLAGPDQPLTITTGADEGGGPHVRTFQLVPPPAGQAAATFTPLVPRELQTADGRPKASFHNFYAYESSFTGGVRVAVADVTGDGVDDLVLAAGQGGGPRVRVFSGGEWRNKTQELTGTTAAYADFFTVEDTFRGGLYIAAGFYRGPATTGAKADIIIGAASGGGPRVMIFDGRTLVPGTTPPAQLANFFAFSKDELNDPLFGGAGFATGVGGVSFGGRGTSNGPLDVLVSTARGPQLQVRRFRGQATPPADGVLLRADPFALTDPRLTQFDDLALPDGGVPRLTNPDGSNIDPSKLNYGATVGGFVI